MAHWTLDDIPWHAFDRTKLDPTLVSLAKAASMVEYNGYDYARYLCQVFSDDTQFHHVANQWAKEEVQHGEVLKRWAEMADPTFSFEESFKRFTDGYKLPTDVTQSVRESRVGELVARCVVEIGTSSYYTALANASDEPVFKAICLKIAADEFRHYKLFYTHLKTYMEKEKISTWKRFKIALGRIAESEDDELAYAFYAAHYDGTPYDHETCKNRYQAAALTFYRKENIERMTAMTFKAIGLKPYRVLQSLCTRLAWSLLRYKRYQSVGALA